MFRSDFEPKKGTDSGMRLTMHCKRVIVQGTCQRPKRPLNAPTAGTKSFYVEHGRNSVTRVAGGIHGPRGIPEWRWTVDELEKLILPSFGFGDERDCAYCGDPATQRDHVIAVSYQTIQKRRAKMAVRFGPWCWACSDCNRHLSNRYFDSFKERCEWAHWRLAKKTKPIEWHQWELKNLDYTLRTYIRKQIAKRLWIQQRADWYETRDFYLNLENLIWKLQTMEDTGTGAKLLRSYFSSILTDISRIYELRNTL